uniref:Uncharacterized protein n=1 Tax=Fagus sylvatica TaxID=28930 RepID=A0A2N9EJ35_FAGSY
MCLSVGFAVVTWVSDLSRNKLRGGAWASQEALRGRVRWRSCRLDLARGGQQLEVCRGLWLGLPWVVGGCCGLWVVGLSWSVYLLGF